MMHGLALGGGGSKGAYELGAWQAFRELGIRFDVIAGTSIGSVNAAFMVMDEFDGASRMWQDLQIDQCLCFSENQTLKSTDLLSLQNANVLARELLTQGGLNTQPLRELLGQYIDEDRVRKSPIRFGLMTALLPRLTPMPLWIEDIPEGQLIDFIMASARFPGLQTVQIGDRRFIDGGVVDNVPISMLRDLGIRQVTAIDLGASVTLRSPLIDNMQLTMIHNRMDLGGTFDTTPETLERNRMLGYLDTLKAYGRLEGEYFSFRPEDYRALIQTLGFENVRGLEQAAIAYDLDRSCIYRPGEFLDLIKRSRQAMQAMYEEKRRLMKIDNKLRLIMSGKLRVLNLLPPMQLAFLMEIGARVRQSDSLLNIPMQHFRNLDMAAEALTRLDELDQQGSGSLPGLPDPDRADSTGL